VGIKKIEMKDEKEGVIHSELYPSKSCTVSGPGLNVPNVPGGFTPVIKIVVQP
jgi:hypothetical protein